MLYSSTQRVTHCRFRHFDRRLRRDRVQHGYVVTLTLPEDELNALRRMAGNNLSAAVRMLINERITQSCAPLNDCTRPMPTGK